MTTRCTTEEVHECWLCLESEDSAGAATAPTGCACRGSAGHAHLSCLIAAARHKKKSSAWLECPTCKHRYFGPMYVGLAKARWALHRDKPEGNLERVSALCSLALKVLYG